MSGGVELPAQTQQELNLSMLEELLDLIINKNEELMITSVYQRSLSIQHTNKETLLYMVLSAHGTISHWTMFLIFLVLSAIPLFNSQS